ncbi:hypothetical protein DFJ63DRAFT_312496 [Scheffersomyces coipomensis]|uniref:uncharacterized protein n=1 Tax=Scheffersomyces coipomensis TaxID=1788519 RepID=UPI00315CAF81
MNLRKFPYADRVSSISISRLIGTESVMNLDLSDFARLQKFRLVSNNSNLKLKLSPNIFENLTDLAIDNIFDSEFYSKFVNLRIFEIYIQKGRNFEIKFIPREVNTMTIVAENLKETKYISDGQVIVHSPEDWPPNLRHLTLDDSNNSDGVFNDAICKLPPYLTKLEVAGYPINQILSQIPITVTHLYLTFTFPTSGVEKSSLDFPPSLQMLKLEGLVLETTDKIYNVPKGVKSLYLFSCDFSMSLNNLNFDSCKSSLEWLQFANCLDFFSLANVDYSEFSRLNEIRFSCCMISSLTNFRPPSCLNSLHISDNPIVSIDESCPLFNNERGYPLLKWICIDDCQISFISPNIELPTNLTDLTITDSTTKVFYFNSSIARHVSLKYLHLSKLSRIEFCDDIHESCKESNFSLMDLTVTNDFFSTLPEALSIFYDKLELYMGRTLCNRESKQESGYICYCFR